MSDAYQIQDPRLRKLFSEIHWEWVQASKRAFEGGHEGQYFFGITMAYDGMLNRIKTLDKEAPDHC